jgi:hypothetical protein
MSDKFTFIDYVDPIPDAIVKILLSKGFDIATIERLARKNPLRNKFFHGIGILRKDAVKKPFWFPRFLMPRRRFIGIVWFNNALRDVNKDHWDIDVFGRRYAELMRGLAEEMASAFNVHITVRLQQELPHAERYWFKATDI